MNEVGFDNLETAIARPSHCPSATARLRIADKPEPFVLPPLRYAGVDGSDLFSAEVVFIEASAAVGKSTMARYLSSVLGVALLDLSAVPVSTGSLKSLVSDLVGKDDPVRAFHLGNLPVIVDALDEGRLLSGETGFESFLLTTGEFLQQDRSSTNRPKLIIFGRHDSINDAATWLELADKDIKISTVEVGYFAEKEARKLIDAYALAAATPDAAYRQHREPASRLVDAYFVAIEAALGLSSGQLWADEQGRAFAGYAPVLAALGSLLAVMDNFVEVANRLGAEGRQEAWQVIETVLREILKRERNKLCDKLSSKLSAQPAPKETYDADEQLTFLARLVHQLPIGTSTRVKLPASELMEYHTMVRQYLGEHPFVRQGKPSNAVLGSLVLAHAVKQDLVPSGNPRLLQELSRQPFLWRSLRTQVEDASGLLIDGRDLGYILNSYWNDPIVKSPRIVIRSVEEGAADVHIPTEQGNEVVFRVALPLQFYAQVRDSDVDIQGGLKFEGHSASGSGSSFYVHGKTSILSESVEVAAESLTIDGDFWMEAITVTSSPRLTLHAKKGKVGWGGNVANSHPWNGLPVTLSSPYVIEPSDVLSALIGECSLRLPNRVLTMNDNYTFSPTENTWVARHYSKEFPKLIALLIKHKLARADGFGTYAQNKVRIHMETTWFDIKEALIKPAATAGLSAFIAEARREIVR